MHDAHPVESRYLPVSYDGLVAYFQDFLTRCRPDAVDGGAIMVFAPNGDRAEDMLLPVKPRTAPALAAGPLPFPHPAS